MKNEMTKVKKKNERRKE